MEIIDFVIDLLNECIVNKAYNKEKAFLKRLPYIVIYVLIICLTSGACLFIGINYIMVHNIFGYFLVGIGIIFLIFVIIWRIITNIHTKKYGEEEDVKIEDVIITDNNINKYVDILSNNKLNSNSVNDLFEKFTVKVTMKTKTLQLVNGINEVLKNLGYDLSISESDMSKYDYDFIKIRRANNYNTVRHDINTIIKILNNNNLEVINVVKSRNYSTNLSIISFENLERLNKIGEKDEVNKE